jgi:hypothetical protein
VERLIDGAEQMSLGTVVIAEPLGEHPERAVKQNVT